LDFFGYNQQMVCTVAAEPWAEPDGDQVFTWEKEKEEDQILKDRAKNDNW
jgi:hypothetical protein